MPPRRGTPGICTHCGLKRCAGKCQRPICPTCGRKHHGDCESPGRQLVREIKARSAERRPAMSPLQQRILFYCHEFHQINGYSPSIREIAEHVKASSTSVVNYNLNWLQGRGYITRSDNLRIARSIRATAKGIAYYDENR